MPAKKTPLFPGLLRNVTGWERLPCRLSGETSRVTAPGSPPNPDPLRAGLQAGGTVEHGMEETPRNGLGYVDDPCHQWDEFFISIMDLLLIVGVFF